MDKAEFDNFADEYRELHATNIAASGETPEFFARYKVRDIACALQGLKTTPRDILDFGCGVGASVPHLREFFASSSLIAIDVSEKSLEVARARFPGAADFRSFDGEHIPLDDASVDLALAACVFHHIPVQRHVPLLRELLRVLRPGGRLFVFEHNPWNPLTLRAVRNCPFDENAVLIPNGRMRHRMKQAGFDRVECRFRLFFPHLLRALRPAEAALAWCPLGAQYSASGTKGPAA